MAELNTAEANDAAAEAAFLSTVVDDTPPAPAAKVEVAPKVVEAPKPKVEAPAPAPVPAKPEYVRVTRQEWDNSKAAIGKIPALESQIAKLTGSMPKAEAIIQQVIEKVQSQTPAGLAVEFSDEDFAGLSDFPDVSAGVRKAIEAAIKKTKLTGTGPAASPAPAEPKALTGDEFDKAVHAAIEKRDRQRTEEARGKAMEALTAAHPEWGKEVGQPTASGTSEPVETDWRKWLKTQPADYAKEVLETDDPAVVHASLDKFKASQIAAPAPQPKPDPAAARRAIMEDAVTPRTDGALQPTKQPTSVDDAFGEGFKTGRAA